MGGKLLARAREAKGLKTLVVFLSAICALFVVPIPAHSQSGTAPSFPSATAVRSIAENSAPFSPLGAPIVATDPDPLDVLTYSLSGRDAEFFNIVGTSGQLEPARPLDYESGDSYSVTVRATDSAGLYDTITVSIEVTNADEIGEIFLSQDALDDGPELYATLTDPDGNISDVSWLWSLSIDKVNWNGIPGAEHPSYSPSQEDLRQFLRVQARYTDGQGPGKVAATLFTTDLWSPGVNHPPEFPFSESGVRSVSAEAAEGQQIGRPVLAGDLDRDLLTYWLSGDAAQLFVIGHYTGQLKTRSALDPQLAGRYFGVVHVLDGKGGNANKAVRIDVGDVGVASALASSSASPRPMTEVSGPTQETPSDPGLGSSSKTPPTTLQTDGPQELARTTDQATTGLAADPKPGDEPFTTPPIVYLGTTGSRVEPVPATKADHEPVAALTVVEPPLPPVTGEKAPVNTVYPTDGTGTAVSAESSGLSSLFPWLAWTFVGIVLLAVVLMWLMRTKRGKESEISLPPPTVGPERRIGPLPILVSQLDKEMSASVGTDLITSNRTENS